LVSAAGCGSGSKSAPPQQQAAPQSYFAPFVSGATYSTIGGDGTVQQTPLGGVYQTFTLDDTANSFSQTSYQLQTPVQQGPQVLNAGNISVGQRGLRSLSLSVNYAANNVTKGYQPIPYPPPLPVGYALELANQAGGLIQLPGQPVAPLVAATQCPSLAQAQTYQFLTIPGPLSQQQAGQTPDYSWDPVTDTAYGSVDISSSGSTITFNNVHQSTLPSAGGSGAPTQPPASPATGVCASTFLGNVINVAYPVTITNPGGIAQSVDAQATIGIGPSGLLVENNGHTGAAITPPGAVAQPLYNNLLGAGTGAVGLPKPASALDTGSLLGSQYLGFVYAAGVYLGASIPTGWSSHLASFGFANVPASCASIAAPTGTLIYGGDFPQDDPSTPGNCDLAVDLGTQDSSTNGLYSHATAWIGASYAVNTTATNYSFPAVAIAGQLSGKNAIFVLGIDSTQPWAIYLLQSN
jgi:hypothetical protein